MKIPGSEHAQTLEGDREGPEDVPRGEPVEDVLHLRYCRFRVRADFFEIRSGDRGTKKRENDSFCDRLWVGVSILSSRPCVR